MRIVLTVELAADGTLRVSVEDEGNATFEQGKQAIDRVAPVLGTLNVTLGAVEQHVHALADADRHSEAYHAHH